MLLSNCLVCDSRKSKFIELQEACGKLAEELHKPSIRNFQEKKSGITLYRQYLGCWSCWYAINKQI